MALEAPSRFDAQELSAISERWSKVCTVIRTLLTRSRSSSDSLGSFHASWSLPCRSRQRVAKGANFRVSDANRCLHQVCEKA